MIYNLSDLFPHLSHGDFNRTYGGYIAAITGCRPWNCFDLGSNLSFATWVLLFLVLFCFKASLASSSSPVVQEPTRPVLELWLLWGISGARCMAGAHRGRNGWGLSAVETRLSAGLRWQCLRRGREGRVGGRCGVHCSCLSHLWMFTIVYCHARLCGALG